ncbi:unnamed protein product [Spodoptera exigua]|nr:unnamed protein product [Spodoptera exigua]
MLVLALLLTMCAAARARNFNITYLRVPQVVPAHQKEVEIECRYDANFTLLSWFKGSHEFFRYRPGTTPSTRSFPILGVGTIEMLACGPSYCHLKLGSLTTEASGLYRCDIERDVPPYKFATRTAHMEVHGEGHRRPLLEGLAEEYRDGDVIQAYCRASPDSEIRWYINGQEVEEMRGSTNLKKKSSRFIFMGVPPKISVQCAEFRHERVYGSKEHKAAWSEIGQMSQEPPKAKNNANASNTHLGLLSILLDVFIRYIVLCVAL